MSQDPAREGLAEGHRGDGQRGKAAATPTGLANPFPGRGAAARVEGASVGAEALARPLSGLTPGPGWFI
jgi:hypothetical protein